MSKDFLICEVYLSKAKGQRYQKMHQRGDPQTQPKAGLESKVEESASHHLFENTSLFHKIIDFLFLKASWDDTWSIFEKLPKIDKISIFWHHKYFID